MSLPALLDNTTPTGLDSPSQGDDHLRAIKNFIVSVFGVTNNTNYTAAAMSITPGGAVSISQANFNVTNLVVSHGTITSNVNTIAASVTWNSGATTFTAINLNVTNTSSNAASLLLDLQVGGSSRFNVRVDGRVSAPTAALTDNTNQIVLGTTNTGTISMAALGAARAWAFPNVSGTVALLDGGQTFTSAIWNGTNIGALYGGTAINTSASTGVPSISAGTWSVAATLAVSLGGTGLASYTAGSLIAASGATTISGISPVAVGQVLASNGAGNVPVYTASPTVSSVVLTNVGAGSADLTAQGANAQTMNIKQVTESHTLAAAATSDTTISFPASCIGLGVVYRVTTTITGCSSFDVGVPFATTRYGTGINLASGNTNVSPGTTNPSCYSIASVIRFTAVGGGASFSGGVIRITLYYLDLSAPSS